MPKHSLARLLIKVLFMHTEKCFLYRTKMATVERLLLGLQKHILYPVEYGEMRTTQIQEAGEAGDLFKSPSRLAKSH